MKLIDQSYEIKHITPNLLQLIEEAGRTCYKSEDKICPGSAEKMIKRLIKSGHCSVLEHGMIQVKFITDRGVMSELTRHRVASFSIESTRYCNYAGKEMEFIKPVWWDNLEEGTQTTYLWAFKNAERYYNILIQSNQSPQQARTVLPNGLKTEIVISTNPREWMHILNLRCSKEAHPQIRALMLPLLKELHERVPVIFDDIYNKYIK